MNPAKDMLHHLSFADVMNRFIAIIAVAAFATGCRSVDVASRHSGPPPNCEIHGTKMQPEWIQVSPGEAVYLTGSGYLEDVKEKFPHHGVSILSGEREFRHALTKHI